MSRYVLCGDNGSNVWKYGQHRPGLSGDNKRPEYEFGASKGSEELGSRVRFDMTECVDDKKNSPTVPVETHLQDGPAAEASRFSMFVYALIVLALVAGMVAIALEGLPNAFQNIMSIFKGMK